jgi:hypothetical protein
VKEYIVTADIASKRDRYAECVWRRHIGFVEGNQETKSPTRILSELQLVWIKQEENLRYEDMRKSFMRLVGRQELHDNCDQLVDGTGVGDAVIEDLRHDGAFPISVVFTNGGRAHPVYAEIGQIFGEQRAGELATMRTVKEWLVPRRDLVADGALILEQGRLAVAKELKHREALEAQLTGFTLNRKKMKYEAESEDLHDDLVVNFLMAAWWVHYFETEIPEGEFFPHDEVAKEWDPLAQFNMTEEPSQDMPHQVSVQSWR